MKSLNPKRSAFLVIIILSILGLGFIIAALFISARRNFVKTNFIETQATISVVDHFDEEAFITYTPLNETTPIEVRLNSYSSSYYVGKEIKIYYNPENYQEISDVKTLNILIIVFFAVGSVQIILGFVPLIIFTSIGVKAKYYKNHFRKQKAKVLSIKTNYSFSIGNTHPHVITYKTKDGKELKVTDYSSRFTSFEEGLVIDVYQNDKNGKCYADPESIKKEEIIEEDNMFSIDNDKF